MIYKKEENIYMHRVHLHSNTYKLHTYTLNKDKNTKCQCKGPVAINEKKCLSTYFVYFAL